MNPLRLQMRNVRTFEELDLALPESAVALSGPNGAGKSTLVNAIDVALFGPESRTLADWLREDRTTESLTIALEFSVGTERYRVRRTYDGKGRGISKTDLEQWVDANAE